jgi:hypothetical protein
LSALGRQIDWLQAYCPDNETIPPRLRLLWLSARLAHANHLGKLEQDWMVEMQELGSLLMEEDAPTVCWADLHLAVNATNRYDFAQASQCLERWINLPRSVPGLRYWAQAASSLGQHAAFVNQPEKAQAFFNAALEAFGKLSEEKQRVKEIKQTGTYLAIVEIDHGDETSSRQALELVIGLLPSAIERLAKSDAENDKFSHHLLLRWLVYCGDKNERQTYLAQREHWQCGYGHPWSLIQLYRGILLRETDRSAAYKLMKEGYTLAMESEQGPTVQLIGACCRVASMALGDDSWPDSETLLRSLEQQLPAAKSHIGALRNYISAPSEDILELLPEVLPFNFH